MIFLQGVVNMVKLDDVFYAIILFFLSGSLGSLLLWQRPRLANWFSHGLAAAGCLAIAGLAWTVLDRSDNLLINIGSWMHLGPASFRLDALAAFFLLLLGIVGFAVSIYAIGYTADHYSGSYSVLPVLFNLFLLSMFLVLTANHAGVFLIVWELMTLVSLFLILFEHERADNVRAGFIYVVMTHIGTGFIIVAFFILATAAGNLSFQKFAGIVLTESQRNLVFCFAFIGFSTKAGIMPFHIWLPKAHPAAPSHVSALLSGVMLKTAIYGLCRFYLEFLGNGPVWWGVAVMSFGIMSAFLGVLYALMENDIKRLLAYSSLENMGVILLGIGAGMAFSSAGKPLLAGLAWAAALYHVFNHAVFKSLLFMGAGSVVRATGSRNMETLGGLIHKMPYTAAAFLMGSLAISSLPPLNGFVSEWMTLQALFFLPQAIPGLVGKVYGRLLFVILGMTAAFVAACFVKTFGIVFLARPRSRKAESVVEAPALMTLPMLVLAGLCLLLGLWPHTLLRILGQVLGSFAGINTTGLFSIDRGGIIFHADSVGGVLSVPVLILLVFLGIVVAMGIYFLKGKPLTSIRPVWACGITPTPRNQYSATGFAKPVRWAFRWVLRVEKERAVDENDNLYAGRKLAYQQKISYIFDEAIYYPIQSWILKRAQYMKRLQAGSVQLYVGYVLIVTIVVLVWSGRN